jgi:hypothetical protein
VKLPKLQYWTRDLLERLADSDPAVRTALDRAPQSRDFRVAPDGYEPVARALSKYLSHSGEYIYTLKLRRADPSTDPVEDFLYRSREGHCQRFAAALTLMLRSVGIPASYILGFKGCEPEGDGNYLIRQDQAHAWVEVLVQRPAQPRIRSHDHTADPTGIVYHWLSLDPTPETTDVESNGGLTTWLSTARETGATLFQNFIVGYNRDRRDETMATARGWLVRGGWVVVGILSLIATVLLMRFQVHRRMGRAEPVYRETGCVWFDRMMRALVEGGYTVTPSLTPMEYATNTRAVMAESPETSNVSDIPETVTQAFYRSRYGGKPPSGEELRQLTASIDRLQFALGSRSRQVTMSAGIP